MGIFSNTHGQLTPQPLVQSCQILNLFEIMVVLHTCKNEEDPIKNEGARAQTRLYVVFFRRSRAANSKVSGGILLKFELIQVGSRGGGGGGGGR